MRYSSGTSPTDYETWFVRPYTGQYSYTADFGLMFYGARWYDPYLNRWTQPDSIIPDPQNPQSFDRYAYVKNNPVNRVDPSGHFDDCGMLTNNKKCAADNVWSEDMLTQEISEAYGITIAESGMAWNIDNLRSAYDALYMMDAKLNGHLKSMIVGTTFTMASQAQCTTKNGDPYNCYKGVTTSTGVTFYSSSVNLIIPFINFFHETGHLLNMVPDTANVFSGPLTQDENVPTRNPVWTSGGYVDRRILLNNFKEPVQAKPLGEDYDTGEYWADAFANYMTVNINMKWWAGEQMYAYVRDALAPYANP